MKRRREFIEKRLAKLEAKRARLTEQLRRLDSIARNEQNDLEDAMEREIEARQIKVSVPTFKRLACASTCAWKSVPITNVYDQYSDCDYKCCWFGEHMDRLYELTLYCLKPVNGCEPLTICGVCKANDHQAEVVERAVRLFDEKKAVIYLDPADFEDDLLKTVDEDEGQCNV